jgi:hypothetical protein
MMRLPTFRGRFFAYSRAACPASSRSTSEATPFPSFAPGSQPPARAPLHGLFLLWHIAGRRPPEGSKVLPAAGDQRVGRDRLLLGEERSQKVFGAGHYRAGWFLLDDDAVELDDPMGWEPLTHDRAWFENETLLLTPTPVPS